MKKVNLLLCGIVLFVASSCSGVKGKAESYADELVEVIVKDASSYEIENVVRNIRTKIGKLSDKEKEKFDEYWDDALSASFMKAYNEELTEIVENVKNKSKYGVRSAYKKFEKKIEKIDKEYRRYAYGSLSYCFRQSFKEEYNEYANAVFEAVKKEDIFGLKNADKEFYRLCERFEEDSPNVANALKEGYGEVLEKKFDEFLKERGKEYEKICKKGDMEKAREWLMQTHKQIEMLLSKASDDVQKAFNRAYNHMTNDINKEFDMDVNL